MPSAKNSIEGVWHTAVVGACFETMACVKPISGFGKSSELSPVGLGMVLRILLENVGVLSLLCGVRSVQSVGVGEQCLYERSPLLWVPRVDEVCCGSGSLRWRWWDRWEWSHKAWLSRLRLLLSWLSWWARLLLGKLWIGNAIHRVVVHCLVLGP